MVPVGIGSSSAGGLFRHPRNAQNTSGCLVIRRESYAIEWHGADRTSKHAVPGLHCVIALDRRFVGELALHSDEQNSVAILPTVPVNGDNASLFSPPQPSDERKDIHSVGYPWPGEWTLERGEAHQKTTVVWKGKAETEYPWRKETGYERLTYDVNDAHPCANSVRGEAESIYELKGRVLSWRGHLSVTSDERNFFYKYTRELLQMFKQKVWQETIPRDHQ